MPDRLIASPRSMERTAIMRFEVGQPFQGIDDPMMRAEVIEISDGGRNAKLKLLTHDHSTFDLNVGGVMGGQQRWRLAP
jgi:hypothetical protein